MNVQLENVPRSSSNVPVLSAPQFSVQDYVAEGIG